MYQTKYESQSGVMDLKEFECSSFKHAEVFTK